jgi:hypothetical protein
MCYFPDKLLDEETESNFFLSDRLVGLWLTGQSFFRARLALSFGAGIKEFIYNSNIYLFGCHGIGYGIHLEFHGFSSHA